MPLFRPPSRLAGALLTLLSLTLLQACDPVTVGEQRVVQIHVVNVQGVDLAGMNVSIDGNADRVTAVGAYYRAHLEPGTYAVEVTTSTFGYLPYTGTLTVASDAPDEYEHFITVLGPATVRGSVVNAQTGDGVDGATVEFIRQFGGQGGSASLGREFTLTTDANGGYRIDSAPSGFFTVVVNHPGFVETRIPDVELSSGVIELTPVAATTAPAPGSLRVILSWGQEPRDLDAHLTGPDGSGGRFHVYYGSTTFGGTSLDRDDVDGQGPETMTVDTSVDGMYRFSVHNFSDQSVAGGMGIASEQARIQIFNSAGLMETYIPYVFPSTQPNATSGNTLRVFELDVVGGAVTVRDNNGATLGYMQASGAGDTTVFLTGGGELPAEKAAR